MRSLGGRSRPPPIATAVVALAIGSVVATVLQHRSVTTTRALFEAAVPTRPDNATATAGTAERAEGNRTAPSRRGRTPGTRGRGGGNATAPLRVHFWDDSTHLSPREDILIREGWLEHDGRAVGEGGRASAPPRFARTDDPGEADLIVWVTVMGRHELEVAPTDPVKHAHKVVVLDHADGCVVHMKRRRMQANKTELAYFKRSFVRRSEGSYYSNCTSPDQNVLPFAYSGSRAMMVPSSEPEAGANYTAELGPGKVYGKLAGAAVRADRNDSGYFQIERYDNFLVPWKDRKWTVTTVLNNDTHAHNGVRKKIVRWTHEFSKEMAGEPRAIKAGTRVRAASTSDAAAGGDGGGGGGYTAYVGRANPGRGAEVRLGKNYFRHLRDSRIVVTCNPRDWEGDFRLWEAFLSGALVMVDRMEVPRWMPHAPGDGKHWVVYDPHDRDDFMNKLKYYSDPANADEAQRIARDAYELVLRHHMPVNRVEYVLDKTRDKLMEHWDAAKRKKLGWA